MFKEFTQGMAADVLSVSAELEAIYTTFPKYVAARAPGMSVELIGKLGNGMYDIETHILAHVLPKPLGTLITGKGHRDLIIEATNNGKLVNELINVMEHGPQFVNKENYQRHIINGQY